MECGSLLPLWPREPCFALATITAESGDNRRPPKRELGSFLRRAFIFPKGEKSTN